MTMQEALDTIRKWQRHRLLREYNEAGQVPAENIAVSEALDLLIEEALPANARGVDDCNATR